MSNYLIFAIFYLFAIWKIKILNINNFIFLISFLSRMTVEQIILQSRVTGLVPDKLENVPIKDQLDLLLVLAEIISPHFEEARINDNFRIKSIIGYIGNIEKLNDEKILWRRDFSMPLPPLESKKDYLYGWGKRFFGFAFDGKEYLFNKVDGSYLGFLIKERH